MSEKPILFSTPMVRAILAGRKTVTRRVIPLREFGPSDTKGYDWHFRDRRWLWNEVSTERALELCRYGRAGDRLWVKETFALSVLDPDLPDHNPREPDHWDPPVYRADGEQQGGGWTNSDGQPTKPPWRPSIYMPRWASRLLLPITSVRIERLQDITPADAVAEGIERHDDDGITYYGPLDRGHCDPVVAFQWLWDSINDKREGCSWSDNPWLWRIEFPKQGES